jgi:hypothetical protein
MVKKTLVLAVILLSGCTIQRPCPTIIIPDYVYERQLRLYDEIQAETRQAETRQAETRWIK